MSIKFDEKTGNILEPVIIGRKLKFVSITGETYEATDEDALIYQEDSTVASLSQYDNLFKNALEDPTNPKKIKYCSKCNCRTAIQRGYRLDRRSIKKYYLSYIIYLILFILYYLSISFYFLFSFLFFIFLSLF